jgi:hypothetical protein
MIFLPGAWRTGRQWLSPVALDFGKRMIFLLERRRAGWQWLSPVALGFGKYYTVKSRRIKFCFSAYFIRRLLFSVFYNFIFTFASNSIL